MAAWQAYFFDFDGVLVDSVEVKTRAFALCFDPYGEEVVRNVVEHHRNHGAVTRVEKFKVYYRDYLQKPLDADELQSLSERFSRLVVDEVVAAPAIAGAEDFLMTHCRAIQCFVVSATPHDEILEIVQRRNWVHYFKEVYGAPATKPQIIKGILDRHGLEPDHCLYFGDAEGDYRAAQACGVPFVGIVPGPNAPLLRAAPQVEWRTDFRAIELPYS